jgi:fibronectin type 3 domain-containing protein
VASLPANSTTFNDTNLTPGVVYEYHVQAYNVAGYGDFTGAPVQTLTLAPTGVTAMPGGDQITLNWTAPSGAASYNIYRGTTPGGQSATPIATGIATTSFTDTGATHGTKYYYTITAVDGSADVQGGGESAPSAEAFASPYMPGDVNNDGSVNFADLLTLAQNYGRTSGVTWAQGDLNGDGSVNFTDLLQLAQKYGTASAAQPQVAAAASIAPFTATTLSAPKKVAASKAISVTSKPVS